MMKRLYLGLLAVAAIAVLTTVGSLALFTASLPAETQTFTTGTVTLQQGASRLSNVGGLAPGDSGSSPYSVEYLDPDGATNIPAWLGLDITTSGNLFTCDDGGKFSVTVTSGATTFTGGPITTETSHTNLVVGTSTVTSGTTKTFNVAYLLNPNADNDCQEKTATISLTVHAVQAANNNNDTNTGPRSWTTTYVAPPEP